MVEGFHGEEEGCQKEEGRGKNHYFWLLPLSPPYPFPFFSPPSKEEDVE